MLRPEQKKKLIGHQIKFDSFPYEISMEIGWPYKKILNSGSLIPKNVKNKKFLPSPSEKNTPINLETLMIENCVKIALSTG